MIVIVEGIDRVGKTRFTQSLVEDGFIELKSKCYTTFDDGFYGNSEITTIQSERILAQMDYLEQLYDGRDYVIDRFHISQYVYSYVRRNITDLNMVDVQRRLDKLGCCIALVVPNDTDDLKRCIKEDGHDDLDAMDIQFQWFVDHLCSCREYVANCNAMFEDRRKLLNEYRHHKEFKYDNRS